MFVVSQDEYLHGVAEPVDSQKRPLARHGADQSSCRADVHGEHGLKLLHIVSNLLFISCIKLSFFYF